MNGFPRFAVMASATLIVVLVAGGLLWLGGPRAPSIGSPTPSAEPTITPTPPRPPSPAPSSALGLQIGPGVQADGTIVFGLHDQTTDTDTLYAIAPDGSDEQLLSAGACCLTVAPDGRAALISVEIDGRMVPAIASLGSFGFSETTDQWSDFATGLSLVAGAWSKDADLAFEGWALSFPNKNGVWLSDANGGALARGTLRRLTDAPNDRHDIPIAFSPDGSMLLFIRETSIGEGTGDLFVVGIDRPDLRQLSPTDVGVAVSDLFGPGASWSPDGTQVAFSAFDRTGDAYSSTSRAYVVDVAGGEATPITEDSTNMTSAHWSPDGEWIAYDFDHANGGGTRDVWLVRPDGTDAHQITVTGGSCCSEWSPDSSRLLFQGNDAHGAGLFIANADGSGYRRLLTVDSEYDLRWYRWGLEPDRTP
jgi:hypothetical protein